MSIAYRMRRDDVFLIFFFFKLTFAESLLGGHLNVTDFQSRETRIKRNRHKSPRQYSGTFKGCKYLHITIIRNDIDLHSRDFCSNNHTTAIVWSICQSDRIWKIYKKNTILLRVSQLARKDLFISWQLLPSVSWKIKSKTWKCMLDLKLDKERHVCQFPFYRLV